MNGYDITVNSSMKWLSDRIEKLEQEVRELKKEVERPGEFEYVLTAKGRELLEQSKK